MGELANLINLDEIWVLLGDFNEVRVENERVNSRFDRGLADAFNGFIANSGLLEYSMVGGDFTFCSGHEEVKLSKLDRFLVNDNFMSVWPKAVLEVLLNCLSDHRPLSLSCNSMDIGPVPFKFFNSWLEDKRLAEIVDFVFGINAVGGRWDIALAGNLRKVKSEIKKWREAIKKEDNKVMIELSDNLARLEEKAGLGSLSRDEKKDRMDIRVLIEN